MFLHRTFEVITLWIRPSAPQRLVSGRICSCDAGGLGCDRSNAFSLRGEGSCQCHSGNNQLSNLYGKCLGVTPIGTDPVWLCGRCQPEVVQGGIEFNSSTRHRGSAPPSFRAPRSRNVPKGCHAISTHMAQLAYIATARVPELGRVWASEAQAGLLTCTGLVACAYVRNDPRRGLTLCSRAATISTYPLTAASRADTALALG